MATKLRHCPCDRNLMAFHSIDTHEWSQKNAIWVHPGYTFLSHMYTSLSWEISIIPELKGFFFFFRKQILTIRSSPHRVVYRHHINSSVTFNLIRSLNLKIKPCKTSKITCRFVSLYVCPLIREVWSFSYTRLYARLSVTTLYLDAYFFVQFFKTCL